MSIKVKNSILNRFSISKKITILILFALSFFFIFSTAYYVYAINKNRYEEKTRQISSITEAGINVLKFYDAQVKSGEMTLEEAQEEVKTVIRNMRFDNNNYIWINDYNGIMVMHPAKPEMEGTDLNQVKDTNGKLVFVEAIKLAKEKGNALFEYSWSKPGEPKDKGFLKFSYVRGFNEWQWLIASGVYVDDVQAKMNQIILTALGINFVLFILIVFVANITFGRSISEPIKNLTDISLQLADNDLTVEIPDDNNKTEIGDLNRSFKQFTTNFNQLIKSVATSAEDISASSEEMSASSEQTALGAQQTATSTAQLAQGAQEVSRNVEEGAANINKMNKALQSISEEAKVVAKLGNDTEINANQGAGHVEKAVVKIDSIKKVSGEISLNISQLGKLSSEIEEIVDLIKNIAGQTNLLALNAAIEAARAGEHGKGFAVVADEVKKLAGQSAEATEKITSMIKEIQNKTHDAVSTVDKVTTEVEEGVLVISDAGTALENIIKQAKAANDKIQGITKEISQVAGTSQDMVQMIENVSAITEETAASAEEISSITEEQTASLEEISASSQTLASIAEKLTKIVSVFKV